MSDVQLEKYLGLINDLCIVENGWILDDEREMYLQAKKRIGEHAIYLQRQNEIKLLKERLAKLEAPVPVDKDGTELCWDKVEDRWVKCNYEQSNQKSE